jgi:hypothetical protein
VVDQAEAAGHIAAADRDIDTCKALQASLIGDLEQCLGIVDGMAEQVGQVGATLEGTNIQRAAAIAETSEEAAGHVRAADESAHFTETENALMALDHVHESSDGATGVLQEALEAARIAYTRLEELTGALQAVIGQGSEVDTSLASAQANVEQLGQRLDAG